MTLVLGCLTRDYAIQVSDRRIMRGSEVIDDHRNKGVLVQGTVAYSYSGLAEIDGVRTDIWLANVIADIRYPQALFEVVAQKLVDTVNYQPITNKDKRLAIIGIGWMTPAEMRGKPPGTEYQVEPCQILITNAVDDDGKWSHEASDSFYVTDRGLVNGMAIFIPTPIGAPVPHDQFNLLCKSLRHAQRKNYTPEELARIIARCIRAVAEKDDRVGKNLLVQVVPRPQNQFKVPSSTVSSEDNEYLKSEPTCMQSTPIDGDPIDLRYPVCYLMPADSEQLIWEMPTVVANGWAITDITFGDSPGEQFIQGHILKSGVGSAGFAFSKHGQTAFFEIHPDGRLEVNSYPSS